MRGTMRHDEAGDRGTPTTRHLPAPSDGGQDHAGPARAKGSDPRLAHAGGAMAGLLALQRSVGNAAVASMVAEPSVQRAVQIDELDVTPAVDPDDAAADAAAGAAGGTGAAVTSDGATTTITGGVINIDGGQVNLNAGLTHASGVLQTDTLIANSVVSSSYTPGAGNVF